MNRTSASRAMYRPLQPSVGDSPNSLVSYRELAPSEKLRQFIYCYWELRSDTTLRPAFAYRIVTDACVDLLLDCTTFEGLIIAGTANSSTDVSLGGKVEYFGIRFLPGCFHHFWPLPLKEVANEMILCREIWGQRLNAFETQLFSARSTRERIELAESLLLQQLVKNNKAPDKRFLTMLDNIYRQQGLIHFEKTPNAEISPRQLRRLFDKYIGVSPKSFARIVRFQSALRAMRHGRKAEWRDLYFDFGYYDQAHFIHDFNAFFGQTPMSVNFPSK